MKKLTIALVLTILVGTVGCTRSVKYQRDQEYYTRDDRYEAARGSEAADRIEKFGAPKKRIFVMPFENTTPYGRPNAGSGGVDELGLFAADELSRELRSSGRGIVPEGIASASTSRDFFVGDKVRASSLLREARKLNVTVVIIGRITKIRYRQKGDPVGLLRKRQSVAAVELEMRVYDVVDGKELYSETKLAEGSSSSMNLFSKADSDSPESRRDLIQEAIRNGSTAFSKSLARVLDKVAWEGRIAKIVNPYVYVNAGKASGIALGDILKVISPGEDVYDPVTGAAMGRARGQVKGTLEVVDYLGADGAITRVHSGGGFQEQDQVQLY